MSKMTIFVPSNFTVEEGSTVQMTRTEIIKKQVWNAQSCNVYKHNFKGSEHFEDCIIYTEDSPVEFVDKLESYITKGDRLL
ncbi:hypothetical protein [Viridibacillus arvi]|uniref:hypothetical protein n=1 Tax=Viridibacillus arvi TaxID=263475 RepID=UPI0034CD3812